MDYFQLRNEIKNKNIKGAYIFMGAEMFLKNSALDELIDTFVPKEVNQLNVTYIDNDLSTKNIKDMCETMPFLSDKRVVVIKDIGNIKDDSDAIKSFAEYLTKMNDSCCLIILTLEVPRAYSTINKNTQTVNFQPLGDNLLINWLIEIAKNEGVTLKKENAMLLVQYCLNDMTTLKNEIDKLIAFSKDKDLIISKENIDHIVSKSIQYNVFKMIDLFEQRQYDKAYEMYAQIRQEGGQAFALLGAITSRYRNVYYAKLFMDKGYRGDNLIKALNISRYIADSAIKAAGGYSAERLSAIFKLLNETDYNIKSGEVREEDAISNLLLNLFNK